ncbi:MAG: NAD(P)/FAD-dependent oxidoreductase [Gemmatimonadota bacterium]
MTDVIIIGGGPAGAFIGSYLSMAGIDNLIIDKQMHPRAHVGESMVTATTRVFKEIGFLETMEREKFPRKYGASWHPTTTKGEYAIWFKEFPQPGIDQDYTYHVDRSRFDLLLLRHASELGSRVLQGAQVKGVQFEDGFASGVTVSIEGEEVTLPAKIVVDASGRSTVLGSQLRLKKNDPIFDQFALHAWYEDVSRGSGPTADFIHIYFLPVERGWAWQIPITDTVTSMGVVTEKSVFKKSRGRSEEHFEEMVASNPDLQEAMAVARRINDLKAEGDYSYSMSSFAGNGWLLVGDAARFVDPIFSSGVSVAAYSAKFASEAIAAALEKGDLSASAFLEYETKLRAGVEVWYEFIRLYYKLLHLFTWFIDKKEYRLQVLQLLQGDVYDRGNAKALDAMREVIEKVESTPGHLWQQYLTDIPID